ncbi:uncharacterized protein LOC100194159 isoform 2 precursor [Zea mays]|uniref:uncharacterized protein LOC100194159 isoform 2 precursor n=1 Tax=Zea mays TaxID=4577 RepID=UPI000222128A|nr:uncharacterized protein LOC100194159 precursor 2 precursor [Zea mays]|eukprot:XP_008667267.1 uncharacterized protein LOC100194159 isoform X3 [Zea mays]
MRGGDRPSASLQLLSLGLVLLYFFTSGSTVGLVEGQKTWCIAKPSASNEILAQNLDYACSQVSCAVIQKGGPCYYPDSPVSRAAVAMNLYYAYSGRHPWNCYFNNSALVVQSDPSKYPHSFSLISSQILRPSICLLIECRFPLVSHRLWLLHILLRRSVRRSGETRRGERSIRAWRWRLHCICMQSLGFLVSTANLPNAHCCVVLCCVAVLQLTFRSELVDTPFRIHVL